MPSAVGSRLAYARLSAVATASRLPTANRDSNNSYTTSWDTTLDGVLAAEALDARTVQPAYAAAIAASIGSAITHVTAEDSLLLSVEVPEEN